MSLDKAVEDLPVALGDLTKMIHELLVGLHPLDFGEEGIDHHCVDAHAAPGCDDVDLVGEIIWELNARAWTSTEAPLGTARWCAGSGGCRSGSADGQGVDSWWSPESHCGHDRGVSSLIWAMNWQRYQRWKARASGGAARLRRWPPSRQ